MITKYSDFRDAIVKNCSKVIRGKDDVIEQVAIAVIAGGHVLLEDVPGTGKTMLLKAFAKSLGLEFSRIQFTPDVLPSDLTGINFYNNKTGDFQFRKGPLFARVVLADEINRAVPRSQSALLEVMEEKAITVDGKTYPMRDPYMIMATQNPIESYGTFPLPEAQLDRFLLKLSMGYMNRSDETDVLKAKPAASIIDDLEQITDAEQIAELKNNLDAITVSDDVLAYIMDLVDYTRNSEKTTCGVSTRGARALLASARVKAAFSGREFVIPEDVKDEAPFVLTHRIIMSELTHETPALFVEAMLKTVKVPLE